MRNFSIFFYFNQQFQQINTRRFVRFLFFIDPIYEFKLIIKVLMKNHYRQRFLRSGINCESESLRLYSKNMFTNAINVTINLKMWKNGIKGKHKNKQRNRALFFNNTRKKKQSDQSIFLFELFKGGRIESGDVI